MVCFVLLNVPLLCLYFGYFSFKPNRWQDDDDITRAVQWWFPPPHLTTAAAAAAAAAPSLSVYLSCVFSDWFHCPCAKMSMPIPSNTKHSRARWWCFKHHRYMDRFLLVHLRILFFLLSLHYYLWYNNYEYHHSIRLLSFVIIHGFIQLLTAVAAAPTRSSPPTWL